MRIKPLAVTRGAAANAGSGLGGAIYNDAGTLSITNSTFSGNAVQSGSGSFVPSSFGGAVYTRNGSITVHNNTFTNNTASTGRGMYILAEEGTATADIWSTIIGQSEEQVQARELLTASGTNGQLVITGGNNLIRSQVDFQFVTVSTDDPLLGPLANNGGPTMTHTLLPNSPATNLGSNSQNLSTDQRGASFSRVVGGFADIGAFEVQTVSSPALLGDYNLNQEVDAADYVLWRKTQGEAVVQYAGADGSGNEMVDPADYGVWRSHFGAVLAPASATALLISPAAAPLIDASASGNLTPLGVAPPMKGTLDRPSTPPHRALTAASRGSMRQGRLIPAPSVGQLDLLLIGLSPYEASGIPVGNADFKLAHWVETDADARRDCCNQVVDAVFSVWPRTAGLLR